MQPRAGRWVAALLVLSLQATVASAAGDTASARLPAKYATWLDEVALLIAPAEKKAFLALTDDARRDAFVAAFWKARDPSPETPDNPFRDTYYARREEAAKLFGGPTDDAAKVWILNGEPRERVRIDCRLAFWPLEIWDYADTARGLGAVTIIFYRPAGGGALRRWQREDGVRVLMAFAPNPEGNITDPMERKDSSARIDHTGDDSWSSDMADLGNYARHYCSNADYSRLIHAAWAVMGLGRTAAQLTDAPAPSDPEWLVTFAAGSTAAPVAREPLGADEKRWLEDVAAIMTAEEKRAYLGLPRAYQRAGFIAAFWKARDPDPRTPQNEARTIYEARVESARRRWPSLDLDQARVFLVNGEPAEVEKHDCEQNLWPLEIWRYPYSERTHNAFELLFYQPFGAGNRWLLWHAMDGYAVLVRRPLSGVNTVARPGTGDFNAFYALLIGTRWSLGWCTPEAPAIIDAMKRLEYGDLMLSELATRAPDVDPEWLASYRVYSTELGRAAQPLRATLQVDYPARRLDRTVLRGTIVVPADGAAAPAQAGQRAFYVTGEVLREGALHESFRYLFELAAPSGEGNYPLVFERPLRPGAFHLVLKVEEASSGRAARLTQDVVVPVLADQPAPAADTAREGQQTAQALAAAGIAPFRLLPPAADLVSGVVRIDAEVGDPRVHEVAFALEGKPLLTKTHPPWSVELRVGDLPRAMRVRAVARDAAGVVLAADEVLLNAAPHRFDVRLVEPREAAARAPLRLRAQVQVPPGKSVDRVDLYLDEHRVGTLWQEPWEVSVATLPQPLPSYARVVATLADGTTAEDVVLLGAADTQRSRVEVNTVEVYASALDTRGRPVAGLTAEDFAVREDGRPQVLRRFQPVTDLPLQVAMLVDTSASMQSALPRVQQAADAFFRQRLRPADRAAVVTFSEQPHLVAPLTGDADRLALALVGLRAEHSTALWDSLVYTLHYLQGTPGRRALLVFSDGEDHGSRFRYEQALGYAQHAGVAVYAIGFGSAAGALLSGGHRLDRLAEDTGGRSFHLGGVDELPATYRAIEEDLRAQYLLVYQSDGEGETLRTVDVRVKRPGVTVRAMRGYLP